MTIEAHPLTSALTAETKAPLAWRKRRRDMAAEVRLRWVLVNV
jgi:hypothetical protein